MPIWPPPAGWAFCLKRMSPSISQVTALLRDLIPLIEDNFRASDDAEAPSIAVTIGSDGIHFGKGRWAYQTGDPSFHGNATGFPYTSTIHLYRDSDIYELAKEGVCELYEQQGLELYMKEAAQPT